MGQPAARAELRTAWVRRLNSSSHQVEYAYDQLRQAAAEADTPVANPSDPAAIILTMRARQAVRSLVQELTPPVDDFPVWAAAPITDAQIELANTYAATDWATRPSILGDHRDLFLSPDFRTALHALSGLYPTNSVANEFVALLDEINTSDIDTVLARHQTDNDRRILFATWIATTTWAESQAYLREHHTVLADKRTIEIIARSDDDTRQHLAILAMADTIGVSRAYAVVTNPTVAEETALDAIEAGDMNLLAEALAAAPALHTRPVAWNLAAAVLLLAQNQPDQAHDAGNQAAEQATPLQRRAHAVRLRALRKHQPNMIGIDHLIAVMGP